MSRIGRPKECRRRLHRVRKGQYFYRGFEVRFYRRAWTLYSAGHHVSVEHPTLRSAMRAIDRWHTWNPGG